MQIELEVDEYKSAGPYSDVYGHGPVTAIGGEVFVCLDCGYTAHDIRLLAHNECDRRENPIPTTWREHLQNEGGGLPQATGGDAYPID